MELLNYTLLTIISFLIIQKPEKESVIFKLMITSLFIFMFVWLAVVRGSILPQGNF